VRSTVFAVLAALVTPVLAGCASAPERFAAPAAPAGSLLADAAAPGRAAPPTGPRGRAGGDAEAYLAEGRGRTPRLRRPASAAPPRGRDLGRLLDERPALVVPGRLAVCEARSYRERVELAAWGEPVVVDAPADWAARAPEAAALATLRRALDPAPAASPAPGAALGGREAGGPWPSVAGPAQAPFAAVEPVPDLLLGPGAGLGDVRYAAARIGADALLVYQTTTRVYAYRNGLANLYPTLLGLLLPGEATTVVSRTEAVILAVRDGVVHAVALGEERRDASRSPLAEDAQATRELAAATEAAATRAMAGELRRALAELEGRGGFRRAGAGEGGAK